MLYDTPPPSPSRDRAQASPCSETLATLFARAYSLQVAPEFPDKFRPTRQPSTSNLL